jgi:hypothetical protein
MWSERLVKNLVPIHLNLASGSTSRAEAGGLDFAPQPETVLAERGQVGLRSSFSPADGRLLFSMADVVGARPRHGTQRIFVRYSGDEWNRISPAVRLQGRSV